MEIWFADQETAALCCSMERLQARWGPDGGTKIGRRLQQMNAAPTLDALLALPGSCRPHHNGDGAWLIDVDDIAMIIFHPEATADTAVGSESAVRATVVAVIDHSLSGVRP